MTNPTREEVLAISDRLYKALSMPPEKAGEYLMANGGALIADAAAQLHAYAALPGSEPVAWITTVKCVGPEYGKQIFGKLPIQSLQPDYYSHTPLFELPKKEST